MIATIQAWFQHLYETTGFNFTVFYDPYDWDRYVAGLRMTLLLGISTILASLVIGAVGALLQSGPSRVLRALVNGFVVVFRNTPPLVQIYFFYFGIGHLITGAGGVPIVTNIQWAIFALSLYAGAFNVEIFRSGIEAVPTATIEAAESLGFSRFKAYALIVLPLAFRISLPALNNNLVNLVKTTSISYAIAVPEMLYVSNQIWSDSVNVPEMMNVLLICYVSLVGILVWLMHKWETAMRVPGIGLAHA